MFAVVGATVLFHPSSVTVLFCFWNVEWSQQYLYINISRDLILFKVTLGDE